MIRIGLWGLMVAMTMALSTGCRSAEMRRYRSAMVDKPAPDFELTALDGRTVKLSDFRGKPILITFFAYG